MKQYLNPVLTCLAAMPKDKDEGFVGFAIGVLEFKDTVILMDKEKTKYFIQRLQFSLDQLENKNAN